MLHGGGVERAGCRQVETLAPGTLLDRVCFRHHRYDFDEQNGRWIRIEYAFDHGCPGDSAHAVSFHLGDGRSGSETGEYDPQFPQVQPGGLVDLVDTVLQRGFRRNGKVKKISNLEEESQPPLIIPFRKSEFTPTVAFYLGSVVFYIGQSYTHI